MAERSPDEIMAEYLLKGAKMLSRCCPACGSPLFEIKGETRCVVCPEKGRKETSPPAPVALSTTEPKETGTLAAELTFTLIWLCRKAREEPDPERCLTLMEAIGEGIEALRELTQ